MAQCMDRINSSQGGLILQASNILSTSAACFSGFWVRPGSSSATIPVPSAHAMKLQASAAAAAVCMVVLLLASELAVTSEAAGCDIFQLVPCMAAGKNAKVAPSRQCCANIASMGKGVGGAKCLCSLLNHRLAKANGVVPRIALAIPKKCRIAVPRGFVCQGIRVPGS